MGIKTREPALIVLEALLMGIPVKMRGYNWAMGLNLHLGVLTTNVATGEQRVGTLAEPYVGDFIAMCNELTEDELAEVSMNIVLNKIGNDFE